jgi:TPR repeat protein
MTEQLPIITKSHAVNTTASPASSLLGRGLAAIQHKETVVALSDLDSRYRQARDIYNRIADYGEESHFKVELLPSQEQLSKEPLLKQLQPFYNLMKQLDDVFAVFQELANQGYGKAYLPLSNMYRGGQGINEDIEKAHYYSRLAFNWCFANQISDDLETWNDLGWIYEKERGVEQDYRQAGFCR